MKLNKNNYLYYAIGKKYSYSSLKAMSKDDLIGYLDVAQHNYEIVNGRLFNLIQHAERLDRALDKACELISELDGCPFWTLDEGISCQESCTDDVKKCWRDYLMKGEE